MLTDSLCDRVLDYLRSLRDQALAMGQPIPGVLASRVHAGGLGSDPSATPDDVRRTLDELVGLGMARSRDQRRPGRGEWTNVARYFYASDRGGMR
jgi:hypothetical protein